MCTCPHSLTHTLSLTVSLGLAADGAYCLSGGHDKLVKLWNPHRGALIKTYAGHGREIAALAVYVDRVRAVCLCVRTCLSVHASRPLSHSHTLSLSLVRARVGRSRDNVRFASCGGERLVYVWDVATGAIVRRLAGHFQRINTVDFNEDASVLASGTALGAPHHRAWYFLSPSLCLPPVRTDPRGHVCAHPHSS
jgi:WD40 repeat protein